MKFIQSKLIKNCNNNLKKLLKELKKNKEERIQRISLNNLLRFMSSDIIKYNNSYVLKDLWDNKTISRLEESTYDATDFELSVNDVCVSDIFKKKIVDSIDILLCSLIIIEMLYYKLLQLYPEEVFIISLDIQITGKLHLRGATIHFYSENKINPINVYHDLERFEGAVGIVIVNEALLKK